MQSILVIEDDMILNRGIRSFLEQRGYRCGSAYTVETARAALAEHYDLLILDINLPDGSGLALCEELRCTSSVPVIFLTANDTEQDMIEGFERGGDDYIAKPFSVGVLEQRVKAILRRSGETFQAEIFSYGDLVIDFDKRKITLGGETVKLSSMEFKLLELLVRNRGQVLTRDTILDKIWDCGEKYIDDSTLSVHIRRLRQKLERDAKNPEYIITVFGIGYTFGI